jgi:transcriptional regulator with XRE-family HTH domain
MPFEVASQSERPGAVDRHIGARLAGRRSMLGMSVESVAVRSRIDPASYLAYENGQERIPAAALFEVSRALRVPVRFVFDHYKPNADAALEWAFHPDIPNGR